MNATRRRPEVCFTLDVLTDGSEYTGSGSLFLSVWKKPTAKKASTTPHDETGWLKESMALNPPLSRYAIAGVGDLTARLSADQRFKLASTRAVFSPTQDCLDGLSALLLALHSAGAPSLHIVSTQGETMEELATIVLGTRRNLKISNCQVPAPTKNRCDEESSSSTSPGWWQVYNDDYITVHASRRNPSDQDQVTYLFSMYSRADVSSFAVIPPQCPCVRRACEDLLEGDLPLLNEGEEAISIDFLLTLSPRDTNWNKIENSKVAVLATIPDNSGGSKWDAGILIKSQQVARRLSKELPQGFPDIANNPEFSQDGSYDGNMLLLKSCTSIILDISKARKQVALLDRRLAIREKPLSDEWASTVTSLKQLLTPSRLSESPPCLDENEIDLDDDDDKVDEVDPIEHDAAETPTTDDSSQQLPQLYVLGTGCATPSAIRGASGYALSFPSSDATTPNGPDIFILDCGEGMTTMLSRHGPKQWQNRIRGIWISHAHLDHYGGLATLLRTISKEANEREFLNDDSSTSRGAPPKRQKTLQRCCWVMSPPKVLRYLDVLLDCQHGRRRSDGRQLFDPLLHHDPTIPPGPWTHFRNIKVPHNCFPAYALLIGWRQQQEQRHQSDEIGSEPNPQMSWFCFSGDTRPSDALVRACRITFPFSKAGSPLSRRFLLLHEATFEDEEQEQAQRKKHSTVSEAIKVAKDIGATRLLLSHFSQRYVSLQTVPSTDADCSGAQFPVGLAMDGLRVPLE